MNSEDTKLPAKATVGSDPNYPVEIDNGEGMAIGLSWDDAQLVSNNLRRILSVRIPA